MKNFKKNFQVTYTFLLKTKFCKSFCRNKYNVVDREIKSIKLLGTVPNHCAKFICF